MKKTKTKKDLVITRTLDAPRKLVWEAWTDPEKLSEWWGPKDFNCPHAEIDLRKGGTFLNCMRSPDGKEFWATGTYKKIDAPQKLVFSDSFADSDGNIVPASYYNMPEDFPLTMEVSVTLEQINNKTRMTLRHSGLPEGEVREETKTGWSQSFDKLAEMLIISY